MSQQVPDDLEILLFCHDPHYGRAAMEGGCSGLVIDWEMHGKETRQRGFDTEINHATEETLTQLRMLIPGKLVTRINNVPGLRQQEAERAMQLGSNEIWLPMVRTINEITECIEVLKGKVPLSIQVETSEALKLGKQLEELPLTRVYIGLNDLRIDRGGKDHLFTPLVDGTIDRFRDTYSGHFGVAGITAPEHGEPIPQRLLLAAMARLRCSFGIARRSFKRDISIENMMDATRRIKKTYQLLQRRTDAEVNSDHRRLKDQVSALGTGVEVQ